MATSAQSTSLTAIQDPYRLDSIGGAAQEALDRALCKIVKGVVGACADRDDDLRDLRDQLEGNSQPTNNGPWPGSATVETTISRELHTTLHAALSAACRQTPYVGYEPLNPGEKEAASNVEALVSFKAQENDFEGALSDSIYLALEGRFAPMYVGDEQRITRTFTHLPGAEGEEDKLVIQETPVEDFIRYRPVDPWDFYVYPVTAHGPQVDQGCLLVIERMNLSREDLLLGVLLNGFNKKAVKEMIEAGPASMQDHNDEADRDGIQTEAVTGTNPRNSGTWECFQIIGRAPYLDDEEDNPQLPPGLLHTDCMWMVCPALDIVFKQAYSRFDDGDRPYAIYHVIRKPRRLEGEGLLSVISAIHEEMTAIERFGLNNMNLEATPMMVVPEAWLTRYNKFTAAPGRFLPRQASDPIGPKPVQWDVRSQQLVMEWLQYFDAQANRMGASQGINSSLAGKTRKAAEVHYAEAIQSTKFDHFVHNLGYGIKETMRLTRSILLRRMREREDEEVQAVGPTGTALTVTREQLEGRYHDVASGTTDSMSPANRLAKQQLVDAIVMSYWQAVPIFQQMGATGYLYALKSRLLMIAGEREPARYLGPNPMTDPEGAMRAQLMAMQAQVQQAMAGGAAAGPGGPGGPGGAAPGPTNFLGAGDNGAGLLQASALTPRAGPEE